MKIYLKSILIVLFSIFKIISGQNLQELKKLQSEYQKALEMQSIQKPSEVVEAERSASSTALPDKLIYSRKDIESLLANTEKLLLRLKSLEDTTENMPYFGYSLFTKRDTIPFWQNLPSPINYQLGPGDEIIISLWGESDGYEQKTINRDGEVYIEKIGILNLGGKSLEDAKTYITNKYAKIYSTLLTENQKSYIDVTFVELKSLNVHFVGYVNIPGVHMIHPFSNVITGLTQAGGVDINGSLRNVQIIRNGVIIETKDIYTYLSSGKALTNIRLLDQDIVLVPSRKSTIAITGIVKSPGYYESNDSTSLDKLIELSGGTDFLSSDYIFVYRKKIAESYLFKNENLSDFTLIDGDSIHIATKPTIKSYIQVSGHVRNPGKYPFNNNISLKSMLSATMTQTDPYFYENMDFDKISIFRKDYAGSSTKEIIVGLEDDIELKNGDHIIFKKLNRDIDENIVVISGEINSPGRYLISSLTSLADMINISGGYTLNALPDGIEIFRDSLKIGWNNSNFFLQNGDSLHVLEKSGLVKIEGEINVPGYLGYKKGLSIEDYIDKAGGFGSFAETRDVYIIYPNGMAQQNSTFFSPKVKEGSIIVVNQRTISGSSKGLRGFEIFTAITSQAGNIATTLLTLMLLINQASSASNA